MPLHDNSPARPSDNQDAEDCDSLGDGEQVHEKDDGPNLTGARAMVVQERQAGGEQEDAHEGEREQAQLAPADRVDEEERRDRLQLSAAGPGKTQAEHPSRGAGEEEIPVSAVHGSRGREGMGGKDR